MALNSGPSALHPVNVNSIRDESATMVERMVQRIEAAFAVMTGAALLGIMFVVCTDVVLRYVFNAPLRWVFDLISLYALAAVFYLTLSRAYCEGDHIRIDALIRLVTPRKARVLGALQTLLALPVFCLICWLAAGEAWNAYRLGLVLNGPVPWPSWPTPLMVSIGTFLLCVRLVLTLASGVVPDAPPVSAELGE